MKMTETKDSLTNIYISRLDKIKALLEEKEADALLVSNPSNIFYLSGLNIDNCYILIEKKEQYLFTDYRFKQEVGTVSDFYNIVLVKSKMLNCISERCRKDNINKLVLEGKYISVEKYNKVKSLLSCREIITHYDIVERLRLIKEPSEIEKIKKSVNILTQLYDKMDYFVKESDTEWVLANDLEYYLKKELHTVFSFPPIIATEKMSSFPHATPKDSPIMESRYLMLDMGVKYDGYCSDLTRIYVLSKMNSRQIKVYELLREHQRKLINLVKPGVKLSKIDKFSREYLSKKGYSENIFHSVGHGVGIDVHEVPKVLLIVKVLLSLG